MQEERRSFKPSAKRDTPVKENLRLFNLLLKGDKEAENYCLRAKADYASVNGMFVSFTYGFSSDCTGIVVCDLWIFVQSVRVDQIDRLIKSLDTSEVLTAAEKIIREEKSINV